MSYALATLALVLPQYEVVVSIDHHGPTLARTDSSRNQTMTEADVLAAPGGLVNFEPASAPGILLDGSDLGLARHVPCIGHAPGTSCGIEMDALSDGNSAWPVNADLPYSINFSVDEHGPFITTADVPSLTSEAPLGESSADIFACALDKAGPLGLPSSLDVPNVAVVDGDGVPHGSYAYVGLGLVEPNPSSSSAPPDLGDNVDALDLDFPMNPGAVYFSLDGGLLDPVQNWQPLDSAEFEGFSGADILLSDGSGAAPSLYASAAQLGLSSADDIDALALRENGQADYQPSQLPFDWLPNSGSQRDFVLFSLRRGSPTLGALDAIQNIPIEPGDLLVPTASGPGVFIRAENLGLGTQRIGMFSAELDGLDHVRGKDIHDWNDNGVPDENEIAKGLLPDFNMDGITDLCQVTFQRYCICDASRPATMAPRTPAASTAPGWARISLPREPPASTATISTSSFRACPRAPSPPSSWGAPPA